MRIPIVALILIVGILFSPLLSPVRAVEKVQVVVSILPQTYFVKQIGGHLVNVISMLPEGGLPHTYEPTPQQMKLLSAADLYVRIKVDFENAWWEKMKTANPNMNVVDSTEGVEFINEHDQHSHHGRNPHIWLSPRMVKIQAEHIYQGLVTVDPEHKNTYQTNKEAFLIALDKLDHDIQEQLAVLNTRKFMVFHPAWSYFARDYGLEQIPIEIEGKEPGAKEMAALVTIARKEQITIIFVQPQTSRRSADTIAKQIGAIVEILDPLAADWMGNMQQVTNTLAEALSK
jgi:zinc transport system substrate-binding protein